MKLKIIGALLFLFCAIVNSTMAAEIINPDPLTASANFQSSTLAQGENGQLILDLKLAPKHHAYQENLKIVSIFPPLNILKQTVSPVVSFYDNTSKKTKKGIASGISHLNALVEVPLDADITSTNYEISLRYQACTEAYCLLPKTIKIITPLKVVSYNSNYEHLPSINDGSIQPMPQKKQKGQAEKSNDTARSGGINNGVFNLNPTLELESLFTQDRSLKNLLWLFLIVFIGGFLTSLTPCIFPMIPITLAVLGSQSTNKNRRQNFFMSLSYVLGIALTYSILGLIAALTGSLFGSLLGSPLAVSIIAGIFILMALSMFGLFEIKLPAFLEKKLHRKNKQTYLGALFSGLFAGLVASPCVGPVLVALLTFVANTKALVLGFFLLFTFALGFGLLFLLLGTFSQLVNKLPRSGPWMVRVKAGFGILMLGAAAYFVFPILPKGLLIGKSINYELTHSKIPWVTYSEEALHSALSENRPIIIDFYADWCAACKELEALTFNSDEVLQYTQQNHFVWMRFDATQTTTTFKDLQSRFNIVGLPHIVFYNSQGQFTQKLTLTGYEKKSLFLERIQQLIPHTTLQK